MRGFLGFCRPSRSRFTLECLLRGLSVSLLEYFVKIERDLRLTVFPLRTTIWQRFTNIPCLRSCHTEKIFDWLDLRSQTLSGEDSTWMVDLLKIPRVVDCFFT